MSDTTETEYYECTRSDQEVVRHFPDLWFTIRAWVHEYEVEFEAFPMMINEEGAYEWSERGARCGPTFCTDLDKSERALAGQVKWDSCSNWDMEGDDCSMRHYCSREQAVRIGAVLGICYDMAKELMPRHAGNF